MNNKKLNLSEISKKMLPLQKDSLGKLRGGIVALKTPHGSNAAGDTNQNCTNSTDCTGTANSGCTNTKVCFAGGGAV